MESKYEVFRQQEAKMNRALDRMEANRCTDSACLTQGCPEHPRCNGGDHTYEQHHDPADHVGLTPCLCTAYANEA